ncbi:MAG: phosphopantothenoylcysteine decarboxylase [Thermoguttaceae bacterium]|nr:phosphopantothenoylcysteine decarboxylase [Thermoguttaceae bacterium]
MSGREVLLGVCGGIAAYKAAELTSALVKSGAGVTVVMTESATRLISPKTFEALSRRPVATSLWEPRFVHPHIELARQAEVFCVAPATANIMAKAANGIADDLMSATILAFEGKLLMAPAMNSAMWGKPATQRNYRRLVEDGAQMIGPATGRLSCGESGIGRMVEVDALFDAISRALLE